VASEAQSHEQFSWEASQTSLNRARLALESKSPDAASALWDALANASRMAEHCYDQLVAMDPKPLADKTFKDWKDFLTDLYKDAWKVYPVHTDLVRSAKGQDLQTTFDTLCKAARTALFDLLDLQVMYKGKPSQRESAVEKLRMLWTELEAARAELGPQSKADEAHQANKVYVAETQVEEISEPQQADEVDGAGEADKTSARIGAQEAALVPLLGRIAAGGPIIAEESIEDILPLPRQLVGEGGLFLLAVVGDSMINAAIADGDWVVVREQPEVENGEIVVAMIEGEAMVKTFKQSGDHIWLMSHNPAYPPIQGDQATILGKVVVVLRRV
jgi:SOS regulatory protein LexA